MNQITPSKLYELYKEKKINKNEFVDRIITIYEFSDSEKTRIECLKTINSVNIRNEKIIKFLEEIVISDPDIEVRLNAMRLTLKKFPENGYKLVNYLFNSSESKEFVIRIAKIIGETIAVSNNNLINESSNLLKTTILNIFMNEDLRSFEVLWGDWFYKLPEDYWNFLLELKEPIGLLELMDYFVDNREIYGWFYNHLIQNFSLTQWIIYFNNSRFSGRFLYILFYLVEEKPPIRFYQIIELFQDFGRSLTHSQENEIIDILKKNNLYDLALILVFHWLNYFNSDLIKIILEDSDLNLILKIKEVVSSNKFGFLKYEYFLYSIISFLLKIYKEIDERYIVQFFNLNSVEVREELLLMLSKILKSSGKNKKSETEKQYFTNLKSISLEFLKILSKHYDFDLLNS